MSLTQCLVPQSLRQWRNSHEAEAAKRFDATQCRGKASEIQEQLDGLNERIERFDARLLVRRKRYETQFAAMEMALAKMQSQQSSLGALTANMGMYR